VYGLTTFVNEVSNVMGDMLTNIISKIPKNPKLRILEENLLNLTSYYYLNEKYDFGFENFDIYFYTI